MSKLIAIACCALASSMTFASDWALMSPSPLKDVDVFIDKESVVVRGSIRRGWFKYTMLNLRTVELVSVDCTNQMFQLGARTIYMPDGKIVEADLRKSEQPWYPAEPDTYNAAILAFLCKTQR